MTRDESSRRLQTKSGGENPPDRAWGSLFEQVTLLCLESSPSTMRRDTAVATQTNERSHVHAQNFPLNGQPPLQL